MTASGRADALVAADETLVLLGIDQSYVIDPFAAIDRLGLALHITNLDNLLGAVVPEGNGGVLRPSGAPRPRGTRPHTRSDTGCCTRITCRWTARPRSRSARPARWSARAARTALSTSPGRYR